MCDIVVSHNVGRGDAKMRARFVQAVEMIGCQGCRFTPKEKDQKQEPGMIMARLLSVHGNASRTSAEALACRQPRRAAEARRTIAAGGYD